ncbi:FAD:protein FMN transferase [Streptosporangium jomthongense]|uniref:FAD:protein FMN transferase n=1 Tax=Marinobacter aromaticivorans TaxID=1494078 RepID=A0ABW2IT36_9GAMM|nr:FAD:protein FMN transferase [Marinobacter aromaticivorans]GGE59925.1 FAD:protein FMN transferase [Streptosporangium jomthongense]
MLLQLLSSFRNRRIAGCIPSAMLLFMVLLPSPVQAQWFRYTDTAMTTPVELEFWHTHQSSADAIAVDVLAVFHQVDRSMSRYREDSELSGLNRQAAVNPVPVSPDLFRVLAKAREVAELSSGAFDVSFGSIGYLYDYRAQQQPSDEEIRSRLDRINYQDIMLDEANQTVFFRRKGLLVDLGGIAKGYAVDLGIERLVQAGVRHARLSAGGDMRLLGDKRGRPWLVGVRDPRSDKRNAVVLPLANLAISTSGDYERFFINDQGERVHHILSPGTGKSVRGVQSVTIIGNDALTTDGLSTAVFVLGPEKGLEMIEKLPGIDAIIIDDQRVMHFSEGLAPPES